MCFAVTGLLLLGRVMKRMPRARGKIAALTPYSIFLDFFFDFCLFFVLFFFLFCFSFCLWGELGLIHEC